MGLVLSFLFATFKTLMQIITQGIDDLLTASDPLHSINEHLAGGRHTITYKALSCKYQRASQAGSSRSICAVTVLNCVRLAFELKARAVEGVEGTVLRSFFSEEMMNQVIGIANDLYFDNHLEIDDLLKVPIFKETITSTVTEHANALETFKDLLIRLFPPESLKPIMAVVFTQTPEHLVCFRFRSFDSHIFVIFDAHSRSDHPYGPAFILASDVDAIATYFNQLLTEPSVSESASKQDVTTNHSFTALVIESRDLPSAIDERDLLTKSVAFLTEKLSTVDRTPSNIDLDTPVFGLEQPQVQETQSPVHAPHKQDIAHTQDINRQTSHSKPLNRRRSEFGWQLNLQVSSSSAAKTSDIDPLIRDPGPDSENGENIPDNTHSHLRTRSEFGWQLALQQNSITDRRKLEDLEIVASAAVVSQADIQTHRVVVGKEKEEASDESFATQAVKVSVSAWEDILMKQLQEEEELVASSAGYLSQESAWILSLRKRLIAEEDKVNNAAASSSSTSYTQLIQNEFSSFLHEFDFKSLSSTESESSTVHRHTRHSPLFPSYLEALQSSSRGFTTLELPASEFSTESHECGVCNELFGVAQVIKLPTCRHTFCRECLRTLTKTRISEGRYPIFCPVCAIERTRVNNSHITQAIMDKLELSEQDLEKLYSLQLVAHSVVLHCPKCKQTMNVDRGEYGSQRIIMCPLPACRHSWCKECLKPLASSQTEHNCQQHGFERLMRKKGWKYCPGCKTPVQKETGCNHMTCGSPGCNVHFCYRCGASIIDTSNGGDVGSAVTEHYIDCVMFEKRRKCIIQ